MSKSILNIVKWFCRQLTFNELASAIIIFHEVLNNSRNDISLKPEAKPPHYRKFRVDTCLPVSIAEKIENAPLLDWKELKKKKESETRKKILPVKYKQGQNLPTGCTCGNCNAPRRFLYINNGKLKSQVKCKICNRTSPSYGKKRVSKTKFFCPHCSNALFKWKESKTSTFYKCPNYKCSHYLRNKEALTGEEVEIRKEQKYNPNFKLHYQYRQYHIAPNDLKTAKPVQKTKVNLSKIHNNMHVVGLVLTFSVNFGLSSRVTRNALKDLFDINVSHQTILNYINAAASHISDFVDKNSPVPKATCAADETYIVVDNKWTYTWFIVDSKNRAICGYNLSQTRGAEPALSLLHDCYGKPDEQPRVDLVTDGNPSYDAAVMAYNAMIKDQNNKLTKRKVIGLKNLDDESTEYRSFKQIVERLNRTYKYHTRPRAGFKSFDGAVALTTLFVAYYNFLRPHTTMGHHVPVPLDIFHNQSRMPDKWGSIIEQAIAA
ncbi:MAG: DDE-type integrase/transposase/recombinase [Mycoplasma sp.]|nr:DDE-type integrase/transposase/recombinase [Mycoplasma sp.]